MASGIASELAKKRESESVQLVQGLMSREAVSYSTVQWPSACHTNGLVEVSVEVEVDGGGDHVEHVSLCLLSDVSLPLCLFSICLFFLLSGFAAASPAWRHLLITTLLCVRGKWAEEYIFRLFGTDSGRGWRGYFFLVEIACTVKS